MNDQSYTQTLPDRMYQSPTHSREESPPVPGNGKAAAGRTIPADRLIGQRYQLRTRLGRGRLGDIYEALDEPSRVLGIERRVAIQLLDEQVVASRHFADEFERNSRVLKAISHPNIVKLLEFGRDGNRHFLLMELIEGASLRFVLDDVGTPSMGETNAIVRAVGDALKHLHAKGIVHGNLKPENVLVTYDYEVKLLDVAPVAEDAEPHAPTTPDIRDDVYGLACLTYELLAGRHPFNANTPSEALRAGLELVPVAGLSSRQWRALAGALALDRDHRTPTVAEFLDEFGITGVERLRKTASGVAESRRAPAPLAPLPASPLTAKRVTPTRTKPPGNVGKLLSLLVVTGLGAAAYVYHDRLRDGAAELMTAIDAKFQDVFVSKTDKTAAGFDVDRQPAAIGETGDLIAPSPAPQVDDDSTEAPPAVASGAGELAAPEPRFSFARPVVTVSESQVAAQIVIQRSGDTTKPASVVWWTSEDTAIAGQDYADLGRRVEKLARGEQSRTIYIPVVNDVVAESTKSFNVLLGRDDPGRRQFELLSGMRVDIADDD